MNWLFLEFIDEDLLIAIYFDSDFWSIEIFDFKFRGHDTNKFNYKCWNFHAWREGSETSLGGENVVVKPSNLRLGTKIQEVWAILGHGLIGIYLDTKE